jgi:hypothetical protein
MYGDLNTNMFLILRTWGVDETLLEIYWLFVSTELDGLQKMHFGELKMRFLTKWSNSLCMIYTKHF